MRLLLIRHGQTPHNVVGALDTAFPGADLTPLGQAQARAVPGALLDEDISAIYASRLVRTQLTAEPLAESLGLEVRVREGLEEVTAGELELRSDLDAVHTYAGCLASWMSGDLERRTPGGPDGHEFVDRYGRAIRSLVSEHADDDTVAVFSHGAAIRVFTATAAGLDPDVSTEMRIMNTGMSVLGGTRTRDGSWSAGPASRWAVSSSRTPPPMTSPVRVPMRPSTRPEADSGHDQHRSSASRRGRPGRLDLR